jgi:hypothetical protein
MQGRDRTPPTRDGRVAVQAATLLRNRYFLWWRLAVRVVEAASLVALGRDLHGLGVVAAVACALYDLGVADRLRRSGRTALWPRLALDTIDMTAWSLAIGTSPDVAVLTASPLAMEVGLRYGWRGLAMPLTTGVVTNVALRVAGQPATPGPFLWPAMALVLAALADRYLRLRLERRLEVADSEIEAAASRAELAGQNSVAAGADTVIDLLTRTTPLLSAGGAPLVPSRVAAWKLTLAEASAGQASYLGVAVSRWQRLRNSMSHDLLTDVELRCVDGAGSLLLSPVQARDLDRVLDGLSLRGVATLAVPQPAPAGREQVLVVRGRRVTLPADPRPAPPSLDLGPLALLLGASSFLTQSLPRGDEVPIAVTASLAAAACALAWWAHRHVDRRGAAGHGTVLLAALLLGGTDAILATVTMRNPQTDQMLRMPFLLFLVWAGPLFVVYARDLSDRARWLSIGGGAAIAAAGLTLLPALPPLSHVMVAAVWPASAILASLGLRETLDRDEVDVARALERRHQSAVERAYRRGRRLVIELVAAAATDAWNVYFVVRTGLPEAADTEFERRLAEVDARLGALRGYDGPEAPVDPADGGAGRQAMEVEAMSGDLRHVTVHGAGRRVDLTLPSAAPIAELMPALIRLCGVASLRGGRGANGSGADATPPAWALARAGEPALALTSSLAEAGVGEGEVLYLVDVAAWRRPAVVEVSTTVQGAVAGGGAPWTQLSTAWLIAGLAVLALLAAVAIAVGTRAVRPEAGLAALLLAGLVLAAGAGLRSRRRRPSARPALLALVASAWALAALGGWGVAGGPLTAGGLAAAGLALAAAMLASYPLVPVLSPGGAVAAAAAAAAAGTVAAGASPVAAAVGVAVVGVTALRLLPWFVSALLAALTAGPEARSVAAVVEAHARMCRRLLASLSAGTAAAVLGAILALLAWGDGLALALAVIVAVSLLLQARPYRFAPEAMPPALAGGAALVALAIALGVRAIAAGGDPLVPVTVLLAGCLLLAGLSAVWTELPSAPRLPVATWLLVDTALVPLALGELGVLRVVASMVSQAVR